MFSKLTLCLLTIALLTFTSSAPASILKVNVRVDGDTCTPKCYELIKKYMLRVKGVTDVKLNTSGGVIELTWDPNLPFSWFNVNSALQMVGVALLNMGIKASGEIRQEGKRLVLVSKPDNTSLILISPLKGNPDLYTAQPNPYLQTLDPELKREILAKATPGKVVTVEGTLFPWYQPPPFYLVVEQLTFETPKKQ